VRIYSEIKIEKAIKEQIENASYNWNLSIIDYIDLEKIKMKKKYILNIFQYLCPDF
jgi:hypothetical protein